jgi:hypothetical protein
MHCIYGFSKIFALGIIIAGAIRDYFLYKGFFVLEIALNATKY